MYIYKSHKVIIEVVVNIPFIPRVVPFFLIFSRLLCEINALIIYEPLIPGFELVFMKIFIHLLLMVCDLFIRQLVQICVLVVKIAQVLLLGRAPVIAPAIFLEIVIVL